MECSEIVKCRLSPFLANTSNKTSANYRHLAHNFQLNYDICSPAHLWIFYSTVLHFLHPLRLAVNSAHIKQRTDYMFNGIAIQRRMGSTVRLPQPRMKASVTCLTFVTNLLQSCTLTSQKITRGNYNRKLGTLKHMTCTLDDGQLGWNFYCKFGWRDGCKRTEVAYWW